ncbi:MAG: L,D-transpeptidase [Solirubrobacteraceae bacterium]
MAVKRAVRIYARPDARRASRVLPNPIQDGKPLVFLVSRSVPGWLQVYLPVRPNQSKGWVRADAVKLRLDPFRLQVNLHAHRLTVWRLEKVIDRLPIAVGTHGTPTPGGVYYLAELYPVSDPTGPYGPYAFGLSAYSNVLHSFAGGPGQVAIHGTNDPSSIGSDVSHGCIHLNNRAISRLAHELPLGTTVRILA